MRVSMTLPQYRRSECTVDGRVVRFYPGTAELLALLLAAHPDRFLDFSSIVEALWPDADEQPLTVLNIISVYALNLRRAGISLERRHAKMSPGYGGWRIPREARAAGTEPLRLAA